MTSSHDRPIPADKAGLRANALAARAMMAHAAGPLAARRLARRGVELLASLPGRIVAGYAPIRHEIDVMPLMEALHAAGRELALPVVEERNAPLTFRAWRPGEPLRKAAFGVPAPLPGAPPVRPDVLIVPLAAFDRAGHRLGYGGGYYDRTLRALRREGPVTAVGAAFSGQELDIVPHDENDEPLDAIVTDRETILVSPRPER